MDLPAVMAIPVTEVSVPSACVTIAATALGVVKVELVPLVLILGVCAIGSVITPVEEQRQLSVVLDAIRRVRCLSRRCRGSRVFVAVVCIRPRTRQYAVNTAVAAAFTETCSIGGWITVTTPVPVPSHVPVSVPIRVFVFVLARSDDVVCARVGTRLRLQPQRRQLLLGARCM